MPVKRKGGEGGELGRIRWLRALEDARASRTFPLSIGDDAAIWAPPRGLSVVLTVDAQVEGSHFRREWLSLEKIGERAVTSSVSDLAAMAARPVAILVSLVLEPGMRDAEFRRLYAGIHRAAQSYRTRILGGNLSAGPLSITVTAVGQGRSSALIRRSGASVGDEIWVTGQPGLARLGLRALELGRAGRKRLRLPRLEREWLDRAIQAFESPRARLREALAISKELRPTSMIDLSDGLSSDLRHILGESAQRTRRALGAELLEASLQGAHGFHELATTLGESGVETALRGGEDYELCFTTRPGSRVAQAASRLERKLGLELTRIGRVVSRAGVKLVGLDGSRRTVKDRGWEHFRPSSETSKRRSR